MSRETDRSSVRPVPPWLALAGIVAVAINLRPAVAGLGPVVPMIRADTGLSDPVLGLLTTVPLLAFGIVSLFTAAIGRRLGVEGAITLALILITMGSAMRFVPAVSTLYLGTAVLGIGVALGNVLLPVLAKRDYPTRSGPVTSLYSSVMGLGATVGAATSVPMALRWGWRGALGALAIPGAVALAVWIARARGVHRVPRARAGKGGLRTLLRSLLAWRVALFMGLQSLTFYVVVAWLPDLLQTRGIGETEAGWLLALSQATSVLGTAIVPIHAGRMNDQRRIVWTLGCLEAVSLAGLLSGMGGVVVIALSVGLLGFVLGGTFGLALTFLVLRSRDTESAGELSGMAQSIGYLVAALGPPVVGGLLALTGGWTVPIAFLLVVLAGKMVAGIPAARPGWVPSGDGSTHAVTES